MELLARKCLADLKIKNLWWSFSAEIVVKSCSQFSQKSLIIYVAQGSKCASGINRTAGGTTNYLLHLFFYYFQSNDFRRVDDEYICQVADSEYRNVFTNETLCAIWYHLYNVTNVKNTHGGLLLLVKSKVATKASNFTKSKTKVALLHRCFSRFLNCANGINSRKAPQMQY